MLKKLIPFIIIIAVLGAGLFYAGVQYNKPEIERLEFALQLKEQSRLSLWQANQNLVGKNKLLEAKFADIDPSTLRDFRDLDELKEFLVNDDTDKHIYVNAEWVCSHYTFRLVDNAAKQGYRLFPTWIAMYRGGWFSGLHMMPMAVIEDYWAGNENPERWIILIEGSTDQFWVAGRLYDPDTWTIEYMPFQLP